MNVRAVLLDFGHTIVDFHRAEDALIGAYSEIRDLLLDEVEDEIPVAEDLATQITAAVDVIVRRSYEERRLQELDIVEVLSEAFAGIGVTIPAELAQQLAMLDHRAFSRSIAVDDENLSVLEQLSGDGFVLGLVSNITLLPHLVKADLESMGIAKFFDTVALSSEVGFRKPDERIFRWTLERMGVEPSEAVFVGDRLRDDISGARAVGMTTVLTRQFRDEIEGPDREDAIYFGGEEVLKLKPDHAIAALKELPAVLGL